MKQIFSLLLLFSKPCFGQTTLEGKLTSFPNTTFSIVGDESALNDYAGVLLGQGKTNDNGQFSSKINLKAEEPIRLSIGNAFFIFWTKPNTTLTIQEITKGKYIFSGTMAKENAILYASGIMQPYTVSSNVGMDNFEPEKQLHFLDSLETKRLLILNEGKGNFLSDKFISYYQAEVSGFSYLNKNLYPALFKVPGKIAEKDIPEGYFKFWDSFKLQEDSTPSNSYQNALQSFIEYKTIEKIGKSQLGTEEEWIEMFKMADTLLQQHSLSLQKQKTSYLLLLIKYFNYTDVISNEINKYKKQFPSSTSIVVLNRLWQKKLASASVSLSFHLKNNEGRDVDIKDFVGKVIYVDIWGSWCKACLLNMPMAEVLKEKFKGKDVVFLYLDFYDTQQKWLTAIKKYNIKGTHLKVEKKDEAYFDSVFNISQGFPRYALINRKGELVTVSAPPPTDQAAYDLIKKYLDDL